MSVICDEPLALPSHRLPTKFGGTAEGHFLFMLREADLPDALIARRDNPGNPNHRCVEPAVECQFDDYEAHLYSTQQSWTLIT